MFPNDDPRVLKGRQRLADEEERSGRVDWARCESRHLFARVEEELGDKRPLTGWSDAGNTATGCVENLSCTYEVEPFAELDSCSSSLRLSSN